MDRAAAKVSATAAQTHELSFRQLVQPKANPIRTFEAMRKRRSWLIVMADQI
jgi:hypothetical protein